MLERCRMASDVVFLTTDTARRARKFDSGRCWLRGARGLHAHQHGQPWFGLGGTGSSSFARCIARMRAMTSACSRTTFGTAWRATRILVHGCEHRMVVGHGGLHLQHLGGPKERDALGLHGSTPHAGLARRGEQPHLNELRGEETIIDYIADSGTFVVE